MIRIRIRIGQDNFLQTRYKNLNICQKYYKTCNKKNITLNNKEFITIILDYRIKPALHEFAFQSENRLLQPWYLLQSHRFQKICSVLRVSIPHFLNLSSLRKRLDNNYSIYSLKFFSSLTGLDKMYSLTALNLRENNLTDVGSIITLGELPCLESLDFRENAVTNEPMYRIRVFTAFDDRAEQVI